MWAAAYCPLRKKILLQSIQLSAHGENTAHHSYRDRSALHLVQTAKARCIQGHREAHARIACPSQMRPAAGAHPATPVNLQPDLHFLEACQLAVPLWR